MTTIRSCGTAQTDAVNPREQATADTVRAAQELEVAARHLRTAARHMDGGAVPRYAAHHLAARGHLLNAGQLLDALAVAHTTKSVADDTG